MSTFSRDMTQVEAFGSGLYDGMRIFRINVIGNGKEIYVLTNGALYHITSSYITCYSVIDTSTNKYIEFTTVDELDKTSQVAFGQELGEYSVISASYSECRIRDKDYTIEIKIYADSLFFLYNTQTSDSFSYVYQSLVEDAEWVKGANCNRMWANSQGGSIHLTMAVYAPFSYSYVDVGESPPATVTTKEIDENSFSVTLLPSEWTAWAIFPTKLFDFEKLYGENSRPFTYFVFNPGTLTLSIPHLDTLVSKNFGTICLFSGLYTNSSKPDWNPATERWEYIWIDEAEVISYIDRIHALGFKAIAYINIYWWIGKQDLSTIFEFMREFQSTYNLDGWYLDGEGWADWLSNYNYIKQIREDVGNDKIIWSHDSVDAWGYWSGLVMVPLDAYANYTLKGETGGEDVAQIHSPNKYPMPYYIGGYGLSQAFAVHKVASAGYAYITQQESFRVMVDLNAIQRTSNWFTQSNIDNWNNYFEPYYNTRKAEYLADPVNFQKSVRWPVGWYREISDVTVTATAADAVDISWTTTEETDEDVRYTAGTDIDDNQVSSSTLSTSHTVSLAGLVVGSTYIYAVRSVGSNYIWGYNSTFST